jgi:hypothetical protein
MSLTKLSLARNNLVSDIPAGDRKIVNLFLQCIDPEMVRGLARGGTPLGSVLGPGQRTLLYHLLTRVHNGDRIALRKLDKSVRPTSP